MARIVIKWTLNTEIDTDNEIYQFLEELRKNNLQKNLQDTLRLVISDAMKKERE